MEAALFYADDAAYFDTAAMRRQAREMIAGLPLIQRAGAGELEAAEALHLGFWPFVREFEIAIDNQMLPREPLRAKFATSGLDVRRVFSGLARAIATMKDEEGSHAAHWRKDAACLGLESLEGPVLAPVRRLIDAAYTKDLPSFFALLAGTEFVAEELSAYLTKRRPYLDLFSRRRWIWGEVHLAPHDEGPSHLEIDLDLARAYSSADNASSKAMIESTVTQTIRMFEAAALQVEERLIGEHAT